MKKLIGIVLLGASMFCQSTLFAADQKIKNEMINHLEGIQHLFEARYAPLEWKYRYSGWELDKEFQKAKETILSSEDFTTKQYQQLLRATLSTTKDYHVAVRFFSTEASTLPFHVKGINGKYFLVGFDRDVLPDEYSLKIGDELVEFDGRPVDEVVQQLRKEIGDSNPETDQSLAEIALTDRAGIRGDTVPKGTIVITVRSASTGKLKSYQLIWDYFPEKIKSGMFGNNPMDDHLSLGTLKNKKFMNQQMTSPIAFDLGFARSKLHDDDEEEEEELTDEETYDTNAMGLKKSFIPTLGPTIWENEYKSVFHAYIFLNSDNRPIGYIRIPHFVLPTDKAVEEFARVISFMESNTEGLVIDEVNNFGGNVFLLYSLISMLSDRPLHTPKHRISITQQEVAESYTTLLELRNINSNEDVKNAFGTSFYGYVLNYQTIQFLRNFAQFIIDEWEAGRRLTTPIYLWGVDQVNPHQTVNYTQPILVLVNELDFSGGDFFPAILQDNKRAVIFGTKTAGAGGFIDFQSQVNRFGLAYVRLTGSIAERLNFEPIENLGVTPDIVYQLTEEDIRKGYQGYKQAVLEALDDILPPDEFLPTD